jgi:hypothetical protein
VIRWSYIGPALGIVAGILGTLVWVGTKNCPSWQLDAGWAGILGASLGVFGTLAAATLSHHLQNKRATSLAEKRRERLKRELSSEKYSWRSIERLCAVIGADESTTVELLIEIGARMSQTDKKVWALESREPFASEPVSKG